MSNFDFLTGDWPEFAEDARAMERLVYFDPRGACGRARYLVEQVVLWMYKNDEDLTLPYDTSLFNIVDDIEFKNITGNKVFSKINVIRKAGNLALHQKRSISEEEALQICREAFHVMYWLWSTYTTDDAPKPDLTFDLKLVPRVDTKQQIPTAELEKLQQLIEEKAAEYRKLQQSLETKDEELAQRNREIKQMRLQTRKFADTHDYNEAQTRELLIDVMLRESGWDPADRNVREFSVEGMPNRTGTGYVDYVLWDDNGKPLALIEAKRTTRSYEAGQQQAKLYADCLQKTYGIRPVIYITNGYSIHIWDDSSYPPRQIQGFYSKASLQKKFFQKKERDSLHLAKINKAITERYYQLEAIQRTGERFQQGHRKALLVMATGTGKTRTAISITDVLLRYKWAKRVLFLADRNALVRQAYNAYTTHLPNVPIVNLVDEKNDTAARVVFSTYPTMLNQIERLDEGRRKFDPGYFDLVIIDEAHRSVYNKYRTIFRYFDALLLGLTATPKSDVDRDTYELFQADPGNPTFAYELDQAVKDKFLVPPKKLKVKGKFLSEGIRYDDLSDFEKLQYDDLLADDETGKVPDHIDVSKLNSWLFNRNTVEQVIHQLMKNGIKVEGGDRLGDTIIFAKSHLHAVFIQKIFDENYPHYAGHFARVIDNQIEQAQDLIYKFCTPGKLPAIAISVDMMDTGIDAPDVVNLVFFKPIRSRTKFNQMIGRGTRLRADLFGPGRDKTHFLIFDFCGNFEFFDQNPDGYEAKDSPSVSAQIFEKRLLLTARLNNDPYKRDHILKQFRSDLLDLLHHQVSTLEKQSIQVRPHLKVVHSLEERSVWDHLESHERKEIVRKLAELIPVDIKEHELTRRFDHIMLSLQHELLDGVLHEKGSFNSVIHLAENLYSKRHIPAIKNVLPTIERVLNEEFWKSAAVTELERVRIDLRGIMHLVDSKYRPPVYTDFEDEFEEPDLSEIIVIDSAVDSKHYKRKLKKFIEEHKNHLIIEKIRNAKPLTDKDIAELERFLTEADPDVSMEEFREILGGSIDLISFIRSSAGLSYDAVMQEFGDFLQDNRLSSNQIQFIRFMIDSYTKHGQLKLADLYEPPFNFSHEDGIEGVFRDRKNVIDLLITRVEKLNDLRVG